MIFNIYFIFNYHHQCEDIEEHCLRTMDIRRVTISFIYTRHITFYEKNEPFFIRIHIKNE